jgi:hypothetical protein
MGIRGTKEFATGRPFVLDDDQPVLDLQRTKMFRLVRRRNAWWSTTELHSMNAGPVFTSQRTPPQNLQSDFVLVGIVARTADQIPAWST